MVFPLQHNKGQTEELDLSRQEQELRERRYGLPTPWLDEIVAHVNRTLRGSPGSLRFKNWLGATLARVQYDCSFQKSKWLLVPLDDSLYLEQSRTSSQQKRTIVHVD